MLAFGVAFGGALGAPVADFGVPVAPFTTYRSFVGVVSALISGGSGFGVDAVSGVLLETVALGSSSPELTRSA